ncbi:MAG: hypothetical protein M3177_03695 [Pseudomonadota bacterium]|nr:hypothetical protein [Pseudomonadota bacterium]
MADPPARKTEAAPEGRGCLYLSLAVVLIAALAFAIAAWINAPSASPDPASGGTPPVAAEE